MTKLQDDYLQLLHVLLVSESDDFEHLLNISGLDPINDFRFANLDGVNFGNYDIASLDLTGSTYKNVILNGRRTTENEIASIVRKAAAKPKVDGGAPSDHDVSWGGPNWPNEE